MTLLFQGLQLFSYAINFIFIIFIKVKETKIPSISPEDVLVEVRSCGLNFYDNYIRHGLGVDVKFPCVLGLECAGIVQNVGNNVQDIKVC